MEYELAQCTCTVFQLMANQSSYMDPRKNYLVVFNLFLLMDKRHYTLEEQMFENTALIIMMKNSYKLFGFKITNNKKESYTMKTFFLF